MMPPNSPSFDELWKSYRSLASVYDEAFASLGTLRPHWADLRDGLNGYTLDEFTRRTAQAERFLNDNGVTFDVFREKETQQRLWQLDLIPMILPAAEWSQVEAGLDQRGRLLEAIIDDIHGRQRVLKEGLLPPGVVFGHPRFSRPFVGLHDRKTSSMIVYAAELARGPSGQWFVMADRADAPVGAGFALENRIVTSRTVPQLMHHQPVQRLASFFQRLQNALKELALKRSDNPRIVLLSPGPHSRYYFEDVYLAGYLGYTLAQGADLAVRDERVFLKTLAGLLPVDVILSRGTDRGIDPLELGGNSLHGVPGLLQALRQGTVSLANMPGCGLVEAPVFMAFLPALCRGLLGEELQLASIATWWCGDDAARSYVVEHLDQLVIKPAFEASGSEEIVGERLSSAEREQLLIRIAEKPHAFVAQEKITRSAVPVFGADGKLHSGHAAVRTFLVSDGPGYRLMPGGLTRIAMTPDPMELSISAGFGSKDLWVLSDGPVDQVTLLQAIDKPVALRRSGALFPSRVADDLFWLGWAMERVDFLARLIRAVAERLTADPETASAELPTLVRSLVEQGQLEPGFAVEEFSSQLPHLDKALPHAVLDVSESNGLGFAVAEMLRIGSLVRDRLSPDTWLTIHQTCSDFQKTRSSDRTDASSLLAQINVLIADLASVSGLIQDGMIRGPAWRFLDLGRRIERGRDTASLLRTVLSADEIQNRAVLRSLLEVLDCRMTYRSRYLDNVQPNAVLDLFITDETNPRSLAFQAIAIADHVDALPQDSSSPLRTEEKRLAMAALHAVRMVTPQQLEATGLIDIQQVLSDVDRHFKALTDLLQLRYLLHSGTPRQITGEGDVFA
ncbi:MAG: circularly permuted type 2 ATP-grasp protein [Planctomycetales bacterium]|nr:circularly permuted type 2 ATP-grasp protein [Planctomycetales bacterium]